MIFFSFLIEHRTVIFLVKKNDFLCICDIISFDFPFQAFLTFIFQQYMGVGPLLTSRYNLTRFFDSTGIKKCWVSFWNTKISSPFSSRALRYFGLLSFRLSIKAHREY
jgi:hypothetical protein